jgi:WD40 repeat protein
MAWVTSVAFRRDGRWLATGSDDGTARLWDLQAKDPNGEPRILYGHEAQVSTVAFSPDGERLVTGSGDRTARLWDASALLSSDLTAEQAVAEPLVLRGHGASVWGVAYDPQGHWLATATEKGAVWLWDVSTGEASVISGHVGKVSSLAFSPDGRWLATGGLDRTVGLWDVAAISGTDDSGAQPVEPAVRPSQEAGVTALGFSGDGRWLATGGDDNKVRLWDVSALLSRDALSGEVEARLLEGHTGRITSLAFSLDGHWLASSSRDATVRLWDILALGRGEDPVSSEVPLLRNDDDPILAVTFSRDGQWLATGGGGWDTTVRLWDAKALLAGGRQGQEQPAPFRILHGHASAITSLAFSPDGQWLASGSRDTTARLWDVATALPSSRSAQDAAIQPLVLQGHADDVTSVAFSPYGRWIISGSLDDTARVWHMDLKELEDVACRVAGRNLTEEEWTQYFRGQPYHQTCQDWPAHPSIASTPSDDG